MKKRSGETCEVLLPNGGTVRIRVLDSDDPEREVGAFTPTPSMADVGKTIAGIAETVRDAVAKISVDKVSVDFGLEIGVESGHVTSLFAKIDGTADLHVSIELSLSDKDKA